MNDEYDVTVLYKYRDLRENNLKYVERIFSHSEVYFSKPSDFNDPFDCQPRFSLEATDKEIKEYLSSRYPNFQPDLNRQQRRAEIRKLIKSKRLKDPNLVNTLENAHKKRILEETGVFCLSEIPDHILMWSHYADSHTGICIKFEATSHTQFFGLAQRVCYKTTYPVLNIIKDSQDDILKKALLTKSKHWEYEKEWRIAWQDSPPGVYNFPIGLLKEVVLGARISEKNKENVLSWVKKSEHRPKVYEAKLKRYEYGLDIRPL